MTAKVFRSQTVSLLGNLIIVFPLCLCIAWLYHYLLPPNFVADPEKAAKLLPDIKLHAYNIWFAAIAGLLLFISGLVSGYFDNLVVFGNIPQRLRLHKRFNKILGKAQNQKFSNYINANLGAIMGNIVLGFGLGFMIFFHAIFNLPFDIRHVTISTGFFAFALFGMGFKITLGSLFWCLLGLLTTALTNLTVSFLLALYVAMKSRRLSSSELFPLIKMSVKYFLKFPMDFIVTPKKERTVDDLKKELKT